jgi:ketol-acid reductoisomerase
VTEQPLKIALVGAGGKMGMRVSDNLQRSSHDVRYIENSPAGRHRTLDAGRSLTESKMAVRDADVVILAVPDVALGPVSARPYRRTCELQGVSGDLASGRDVVFADLELKCQLLSPYGTDSIRKGTKRAVKG